jgi:hypothetical protein
MVEHVSDRISSVVITGKDSLEVQTTEVLFHLLHLSRFENVLKSNQSCRESAVMALKKNNDDVYYAKKKLESLQQQQQSIANSVSSSVAIQTANNELESFEQNYQNEWANYLQIQRTTKVRRLFLFCMRL